MLWTSLNNRFRDSLMNCEFTIHGKRKARHTHSLDQSNIHPFLNQIVLLPRPNFKPAATAAHFPNTTVEQDDGLRLLGRIADQMRETMPLRSPPVISIPMKRASQGASPDDLV